MSSSAHSKPALRGAPPSAISPFLYLAPLLFLPALYFYNSASSLPSSSSPATTPEPSTPLFAHGVSCPIQVDPRNIGPDWHPEEDAEYVKKAIGRLQGAVRIPTESFDDMKEDPKDEERFEIFGQLHEYLVETFPLLHQIVKRDRIAHYGLLYTWQGSDPSLKPIVLMAHQDVVPVNPSTWSRWTHPPFEAHLDEDGWLWGRGSADCKNTLVGILSAIEQLVGDGFEPTRTIIVSSGADEEISGRRTAKSLALELFSRYGQDGVSLIVDEGFSGVDPAFGRMFARLGMAEKGAVSVNVAVLADGGHSSVPPEHTGIGILALMLVELEKNPDVPRLRPGNPILSYLNCAADFGEVDEKLRMGLRSEKAWPMLGMELAKKDPIVGAFLKTTQAIDLVHGGIKSNALPEHSSATINYRIDFLSSVNETLTRIAHILEPVAASLNITLDAFGSHSDIKNNVVRLSIVPELTHVEPAPLTPSTGAAFELMSGTIKHVFNNPIVAPSAMIANTDTKWTWNLTRNIYRFAPGSLELIKNFHTVDERIHTSAHISGIRFFHTLIRNTEGWTD